MVSFSESSAPAVHEPARPFRPDVIHAHAIMWEPAVPTGATQARTATGRLADCARRSRGGTHPRQQADEESQDRQQKHRGCELPHIALSLSPSTEPSINTANLVHQQPPPDKPEGALCYRPQSGLGQPSCRCSILPGRRRTGGTFAALAQHLLTTQHPITVGADCNYLRSVLRAMITCNGDAT